MFEKIKKFIGNREEYYPNIYIFAYHLLKGVKKLLVRLRLAKGEKLDRDMFDWPLYFLHYKGELVENDKKYLQSLAKGDYRFDNGKLAKTDAAVKPLHPVHRFLYETIMLLGPESVFEIGCGTGPNLHNLKILLPDARVCGIDLSERQLKGLTKTYPGLVPYAKQADATAPFSPLPFERCDLAFTQAVIMHIHTGELHLVALENLFKMAGKYVVLIERAKNHPLKDDIRKLFDQGRLGWDKLFFYYRVNPENGKPMGMICSLEPLSFPELVDYKILLDE